MISKKKNFFENSDNFISLITEVTNDLLVVTQTDYNFKIQFINDCIFLERLGYSRNSIEETSFLNLIYLDDVEKTVNYLKNNINSTAQSQEIRIKSMKDKFIWVEITAKKFTYGATDEQILINLRDLTKQKEIEGKLKESKQKFEIFNERYQNLFKNMFVGFAYHKIIVNKENKPIDYEFLEANPAFEKLTGLKVDEIVGKTVREILPGIENDPTDWIGKYGKVALSGIPITFESYAEPLDQWFSITAYSPKNEYFAVIFTNITKHKKAEYELKESENKFRTLFDNVGDSIIIVDLDSNILEVNKTACKHLGYSKDELLKMTPMDLVTPEYAVLILSRIKELTQKGSAFYESITVSKDGEIRPVEISSKIINYKNEKAVLSVIRDITERNRAKEKLKESEEKYRLISENANDMIVVLNDKFEYEYLNENMHKHLLGYSKNELLGKTQLHLIHPDDLKQTIIATSRILRKGKGSHQVRFLHKNGSYKWLEITGKTFFDSRGDKKVLAISRDITDRKEVAKKLEESEEKYRSLFENMNVGFAYHEVLVDDENKPIDYKYIEVNPAFEKLTSLKKEDLIGKTVTQVLPGIKNDPADWIGKFGNVGLTGIPLNIEEYSEPIKKWYKVSGYSPKRRFFAVTFTDITDQKEVESRIRESEAKYHDLFETSPLGVILTDLKGDIIECNSAIEDITGYPIEKFIGKNIRDLSIYYENGLKVLLEGFKDLLNQNKLEYVEFQIKHRNNRLRWVQLKSRIVKRKEESFILSVVNDISTQKTAEEALKESEKKYRDLLDSSSIGVMEIDVINNRISYINPRLLAIIGYKKEELTGVAIRDKIIHPNDLSKLIPSSEETDLEFRIIDKYGNLKWLNGKKIPHFDENKAIVSVRFWLDDITEKKMYEELIYELNINFLNFTADIRNNIELLLNTGLKLLNGDLILYAHKNSSDGEENYQLISSDNESLVYTPEDFFENLFISEIFKEEHDFPQSYFDVDKKKYARTDPFLKKNGIKGCFGKIIRSQDDLDNVVCVYYKENPKITGQDKLVMFLICDAIEIEQRRWQVQQDLEKQNITLNKMNHLKTELFSRTSHELKTPLISIKGFTELLLTLHKSKLDTEMISILEEIKEGSKRLEKTINLLLEGTKLEAEQLELNLRDDDLAFLIKFCVKELKGLATLRNQNVSINLHDELKTEFDKERIYEVMSNLLLNSIKYTPPGGVISIFSESNDNFYIISIKDNGIGFTEEEKTQVFKQFGKIERYGQGWDVAIEGTGLGLYITKKLVELHGGKIWLESEGRNKGSTFKFSLPRRN